MNIKPQFGIRFLMLLIFVAALCVFAWQSIPKRGKPILNGQIVDSHGAPIPNVEITLYHGYPSGFPRQKTQTDRLGNFEFSPLETGMRIMLETGSYNDLLVKIGVSHPEFESVDGVDFWDVTVPYVENRKHEWNLVLTRIPNENAK